MATRGHASTRLRGRGIRTSLARPALVSLRSRLGQSTANAGRRWSPGDRAVAVAVRAQVSTLARLRHTITGAVPAMRSACAGSAALAFVKTRATAWRRVGSRHPECLRNDP
jgi:hypothetical protein